MAFLRAFYTKSRKKSRVRTLFSPCLRGEKNVRRKDTDLLELL